MRGNKALLLASCVLCFIGPLALVHGDDGTTSSDPVPADERTCIEPFDARYRVARDGITVGEARLQIDYPDKGHYRMRASLHLTGLISLFSSESIDEEVHGELVDGMPLPLTYRSQRTGKKARTVDQTFDWARAEAVARKNGEETVLTLRPRTVDPLSLHFLAMLDLRNNVGDVEYAVISGNRLKTYHSRLLGKATITTVLGEFETLMVSRQRSGSSKQTTFWYAPERGYLPVQISKTDDGAEVVQLTIEQLTRGSRSSCRRYEADLVTAAALPTSSNLKPPGNRPP